MLPDLPRARRAYALVRARYAVYCAAEEVTAIAMCVPGVEALYTAAMRGEPDPAEARADIERVIGSLDAAIGFLQAMRDRVLGAAADLGCAPEAGPARPACAIHDLPHMSDGLCPECSFAEVEADMAQDERKSRGGSVWCREEVRHAAA